MMKRSGYFTARNVEKKLKESFFSRFATKFQITSFALISISWDWSFEFSVYILLHLKFTYVNILLIRILPSKNEVE